MNQEIRKAFRIAIALTTLGITAGCGSASIPPFPEIQQTAEANTLPNITTPYPPPEAAPIPPASPTPDDPFSCAGHQVFPLRAQQGEISTLSTGQDILDASAEGRFPPLSDEIRQYIQPGDVLTCIYDAQTFWPEECVVYHCGTFNGEETGWQEEETIIFAPLPPNPET